MKRKSTPAPSGSGIKFVTGTGWLLVTDGVFALLVMLPALI